MLRVLHVTPYFAPAFVYGGPPRSIHGLCKALSTANVDVEVVTTTANGDAAPLPAAIEQPRVIDGVRARYFPLARTGGRWDSPLLRQALQAGIASYDLVHIHGLWHRPGWDAGRAARVAGVPYVISPRGMLEQDAVAIRRFRKVIAFSLIERRNLRFAAALHATSDTEVSTLERRRLGPTVFLAPNGVNLEPVARAESETILRTLGLTPRDRFILFLGRIHPIKRLDLLAGAARLLRARDVKIVIAGPDERGHRASLEPLFAASGLSTRWIGSVDEQQKRALLGAAKALVLCSDSESFGLAVLEAMAAGVPVVTTDTLPWQELAAEHAGYHVPQTAVAIAEALDEVLRDPPKAVAMGARGRALVERRYTWSIVAQTMLTQYLTLTKTRAEGRPRVA